MIKEKILTRKNVLVASEFATLFAIAVAAPLFKQQFITGPIVNSALLLSAIFLSFENAVLIALLPSLIALSVGLLSPVLLPMIPFIIAGNIVYIYVFKQTQKTNYWLAILLASLLKFAFIFGASQFLVGIIVQKQLPAPVALMMSWPQLVTALAGGIIAFLVLKTLKKV